MNCKCDYNNITTIMLDLGCIFCNQPVCVGTPCINEEGISDDTMCPEGQICDATWSPCGGKCIVPKINKRKNWLHYLSVKA